MFVSVDKVSVTSLTVKDQCIECNSGYFLQLECCECQDQWIYILGIRGARYITKPNTAWHRNIWWTGRDQVYLLHSTLLFIILHTQSIAGPTVYLCKRCGIVSEFGARNWSICRRRIPRIYALATSNYPIWVSKLSLTLNAIQSPQSGCIYNEYI